MTRTHDAFRENTAGRADIADTPALIAYYDLPVMRALGLYREEALADNGGHQRKTA